MNRLQAELQRLYLPRAEAPGPRTLVLELAGPRGWEELAPAWQGVQQDLQLPAPAIAVNGSDALQLWFSLADPVPPAQARAFLELLCRRYLPEVPAGRLRLHAGDPAPAPPPFEAATGQWSAFVAPDLASLFAPEPWLDLPPGADAQADQLARLQGMRAGELVRALAELERPAPAVPPAAAEAPPPQPAPASDPGRFLLAVMNDPAIDMHLRIEAAKALLQAGAPR